MNLNALAYEVVQRMLAEAIQLQIAPQTNAVGTTLIDCGIAMPGSLEAGLRLAEVCLAGLGTVKVVPGQPPWTFTPSIEVQTNQPVAACMASQYAGWKIEGKNFFAMGSGPMRAAGSREPLFDKIGYRERTEVAVGVLESRRLPPDEVCLHIAEACGVDPKGLFLLVAPTASIAGTVQIVARSVETALHKLSELSFDLSLVDRGFGTAPLPPVGSDDLTSIGLTNDAILYGGHVKLWLHDDGRKLASVASQVPSSSSPMHGKPFAELFAAAGGDFYAIDPMLFSPALVEFHNIDTGEVTCVGQLEIDVLRRSFGITSSVA